MKKIRILGIFVFCCLTLNTYVFAEDTLQTRKVFRILTVDGGGIKGLYSSTILEVLEEKYNCRMSDHFDMFCGTSTGGLIALGLSANIPAKEISKLYVEKGEEIFPPMSSMKAAYRQAVSGGKFSDKPLKEALQNLLQDKKLKESRAFLYIPSFCITTGLPYTFRYYGADHDLDNEVTYVDVALSTSAAPTLLPVHTIESMGNKQFIDGGTWADNPTAFALMEAIQYFVGEGKPYDSIEILSISSLDKSITYPAGSPTDKSLKDWKDDLFEIMMSSQSQSTDALVEQMAAHLSVPVKYFRIPALPMSAEEQELIHLDMATPESIEIMQRLGEQAGESYGGKEEVARMLK